MTRTQMPQPLLRDQLSTFRWFSEPAAWRLGDALELTTQRDTDFWQRTHYGFQRDNGHFFFTPRAGDFTMTAHVAFAPNAQYDQCGVMCRVDANAWIKASVEHEPGEASRLGSVVTNAGYSDWATQDVGPEMTDLWYRLSRRGEDFRIEWSTQGTTWQQMRIAHLVGCPSEVAVGVYACSPVGAGFQCRVLAFELGANVWQAV